MKQYSVEVGGREIGDEPSPIPVHFPSISDCCFSHPGKGNNTNGSVKQEGTGTQWVCIKRKFNTEQQQIKPIMYTVSSYS
jgi:hypothetical protein